NKRGFVGQKPRSRRRYGMAGVTESSKSIYISTSRKCVLPRVSARTFSCKKREPGILQFELVANIVSWNADNLSQLHRIHANNLSPKRR
ncbi:hypothetical protein, partial [Pseudomonas savastanoi]|uniref:hypothetical protein n=1 Tax=Pseudomonas savastanoi TaxID=29438 RepID=UPI001C500E40